MINLHLGDCMEALKDYEGNQFDLAIVDPPYGIDVNMNMGLKRGQRKRHEKKKWDLQIPDSSYYREIRRVSKNQIIWGGNYFPLGPTKHYIFWDKKTPVGMSFSDGELAWTSFDKAIKKFTYYNVTNDKIHPTQKPVALYKWLLKNYAKPGDKILDTHAGSFSIGIACYDMGFDLEAWEIDEDYHKAAMKRFNTHKAQGQLFQEKPKPGSKQLTID